jgi:hypothetical protein
MKRLGIYSLCVGSLGVFTGCMYKLNKSSIASVENMLLWGTVFSFVGLALLIFNAQRARASS